MWEALQRFGRPSGGHPQALRKPTVWPFQARRIANPPQVNNLPYMGTQFPIVVTGRRGPDVLKPVPPFCRPWNVETQYSYRTVNGRETVLVVMCSVTRLKTSRSNG